MYGGGNPYYSPYSSAYSSSYSNPYSSSLYSSPYSSYSPYGSGAYGPNRFASPYSSGPYDRFNEFGGDRAGWPSSTLGGGGGGGGINGLPSMNDQNAQRSMVERVHGGFATVGGLTEGMARVTGMLDHNWQSLFNSFTSIVRLVEGVKIMRSEFWALLKALSLVKLLHSLYNWVRGPPATLTDNVSENVADFLRPPQDVRRRSPVRLLLLLAGIAMLVGPWLWQRMRTQQKMQVRTVPSDASLARRARSQSTATTGARRRPRLSVEVDQRHQRIDAAHYANNGADMLNINDNDLVEPSSSVPSSRFGEATTDIVAQSARELTLQRGELVRVVARVGQRWLAAETRDGRRGLVLAEFIQARGDLEPPPNARLARAVSSPPTTFSAVGGGSGGTAPTTTSSRHTRRQTLARASSRRAAAAPRNGVATRLHFSNAAADRWRTSADNNGDDDDDDDDDGDVDDDARRYESDDSIIQQQQQSHHPQQQHQQLRRRRLHSDEERRHSNSSSNVNKR